MMMGVWFAATLPADILAGYLGGFWSSLPKTAFFLLIAAVAAVAADRARGAQPRPAARAERVMPDVPTNVEAQCVQGSDRLNEKLSE